MSLGAPHDHDCQCVRCQSRRKPTPLQIATQEYVYWRDSSDADPHFLDISIGAMGAAANIASRLAGANPEGIDYKTVSPEQITAVLMEIQLVPRMIEALISMVGNGREQNFIGPNVKAVNTEGYHGIEVAKAVLRKLSVVNTRGAETPRERKK